MHLSSSCPALLISSDESLNSYNEWFNHFVTNFTSYNEAVVTNVVASVQTLFHQTEKHGHNRVFNKYFSNII